MQLSGGGVQSLAVKTNGTLWSWGRGAFGSLGLNDTANQSSPVQVGALTEWLESAAGTYHSVAVKNTGTLWSWGANSNGQLGLNDTVGRSSPVQVGALTTWQKLPKMPFSGFTFAIKG
jgi:alpha-tubulin suppressor-like RCC1 family protein